MTILSPSGLEVDDYNMPGWVHIYNRNIDRLNRVLLKIQALSDIDTAYLKHGSMLTWDSTENKWIPRIYGKNLISE